MSDKTVLLDISAQACTHQAQVDEVKQRLGIRHSYFDCWIYNFLENKNFNVDETIVKLRRRDDFEKQQLATAEITEWMLENMQKGIIQLIGNDKEGRVVFYVYTARDKPTAAHRDESKKNFDMLVTYGTRLRAENKRCQITMLINQDGASMWSNIDITLQADIALRVAKYYPGCIDKIYICKMGRTLATLAKPIFSRLPAIISERIFIISDSDIKKGKLLEFFDENVLPLALGGKNDCDKPENYKRFSFTIKEYFDRLKASIQRGVNVKEWELENLRNLGLNRSDTSLETLRRSMIEHRSGPSTPVPRVSKERESYLNRSWSAFSGHSVSAEIGDENFITCDTLNFDRSLSLRQTPLCRVEDVQLIPRNLFADYLHQFAAFESFFRIGIVEAYQRECLQLLQRESEERQAIEQSDELFQSDSHFSALPPALRLMAKGLLWLCLLLMSVYFFTATFFISVLGDLTLVFIFFAMFLRPYHVFLYGMAFAITAAQFAILCSHGFQIARKTFDGRLLQAFKAFGYKAFVFQMTVYVLCTLACFITFCVVSSQKDPFTGVQWSLTVGWIICIFLIFVYHVLFAFGPTEMAAKSYIHGSRINNAETTLYLFMDVDFDDDPIEGRTGTEILTLTLIAVLNLAAGVTYISGGRLFFLCTVIALLGMLLLLCVVFLFSNNTSRFSTLMLCTAMYACLFWMNVVFTMRMHNWDNALLVSLLMIILFFLTVFLSINGPQNSLRRRWFFRISWAILFLHFIGSIIGLFIDNYYMAFFVLALAVHLLIYRLRSDESTKTYGVFIMITAFTLTLLGCCLLAEFNHSELYSHSVSDTLLPDYYNKYGVGERHAPNAVTGDSTDSGTATYTLPLAICLFRFPNSNLSVLDMSLFAKLGYNINTANQGNDLLQWFPDFKLVKQIGNGNKELLTATVFRRETAELNTTVIAIRCGNNLHNLIEAMSLWIVQHVLSIFSFIISEDLVFKIIPYLAFADNITPLNWKASAKRVSNDIQEYISGFYPPSEYVYIVGHGPIGTVAVLNALEKKKDVFGVLFSAPQITFYLKNVNSNTVMKRLFGVQTNVSVFSSFFSDIPFSQTIPCNSESGKVCDRIDTTVRQLDSLCHP